MLIRPDELYPEGAGAAERTLIDVRSLREVARGAMPGSHALPLMSDRERHEVGIRYKEAGQEAAIALGYELAGPHLPGRIEAWRGACARGPAAVACWRGGLRSELALAFIDRGDVARVAGGYKALRRHVMEALPRSLGRKRLVVLTGLTGSGKTRLLRALPADGALQVLDLEGAARHRGSAFGAEDVPQPSQQTFENTLATELLLSPAERLVVEDESRYVGRRTLPDDLMEAMRVAPLAVLETPMAERVSHIVEEYVLAMARRHGVRAARERLEHDTLRIRKRLGGGRTDGVVAALHAAEQADAWYEPGVHRWWVQTLLEHYYDRLYRKAIDRHERPVAFRGDAEEVTGYLRSGRA
jgi:tRNA 2-selenouridine synthase